MSWLRPMWVRKFYAVFGSKLQPAADRIKKWEFSPEITQALQELCEALPNVLGDGLLAYITKVYKKIGLEEAEAWLRKILEILKNFSFKEK